MLVFMFYRGFACWRENSSETNMSARSKLLLELALQKKSESEEEDIQQGNVSFFNYNL